MSTLLNIARVTSYPDRLRSYKIVVDEKEMGIIKAGESVQVSIEPGNHRVYLKIDWCRSNIIEFTAKAEVEYKIECGSSLLGWRIFLALLYVTIWWDKYLWIRFI